MISPITLIPFSVIFVSLSVHFGMILLKTSGKSKNYKYIFITIAVIIELAYISIILAANIKIAQYHLEERELNNTLRAVIASIYCFDVVMFIVRTIVFIKKLVDVSKSQSDNAQKKKRKYFILCFWLIFITLGYIINFTFLFILTFDSTKKSPTKIIAFNCLFYFGFAVCCFGLNFLFKPKNSKDKSSSTKSKDKSTNN